MQSLKHEFADIVDSTVNRNARRNNPHFKRISPERVVSGNAIYLSKKQAVEAAGKKPAAVRIAGIYAEGRSGLYSGNIAILAMLGPKDTDDKLVRRWLFQAPGNGPMVTTEVELLGLKEHDAAVEIALDPRKNRDRFQWLGELTAIEEELVATDFERAFAEVSSHALPLGHASVLPEITTLSI